MEKDDEVKGTGDQLDFGARMYDSRLGRFMSQDPLKKRYPYMTPYIFAADNPIVFIDYEGLGPIIVIQSKAKSSTIKSLLGSASGESIKKTLNLYLSQQFHNGRDIQWLVDNYKRSRLPLKYIEGSSPTLSNWTSSFGVDLPYVAYKDGNIDDPYIYVVLTEEDENGLWVQNTYKILDKELQQEMIDDLNERIAEYEKQIQDIEEKINNLESFIAEGERLMEEDSKALSLGPPYSMRSGKITPSLPDRMSSGKNGAYAGQAVLNDMNRREIENLMINKEVLKALKNGLEQVRGKLKNASDNRSKIETESVGPPMFEG